MLKMGTLVLNFTGSFSNFSPLIMMVTVFWVDILCVKFYQMPFLYQLEELYDFSFEPHNLNSIQIFSSVKLSFHFDLAWSSYIFFIH